MIEPPGGNPPPHDETARDDLAVIPPSEPPNWRDRLVELGTGLGDRVTETWKKAIPPALLPNLQGKALQERMSKTFSAWFQGSDDQVQEILERVRSELPTTEAILIGKPQSGKSSIVRGLTGVPADIIGQGYRPHTQHTQRYNYPTDDLPLLIFTDTVGLGDAAQNTAQVIQELLRELGATELGATDLEAPKRADTRGQTGSERLGLPLSNSQDSSEPSIPEADLVTKVPARVMILTVKINDFATDTLQQIARQLRQTCPQVPCLLVVTCLHEVYPPSLPDHPNYPPTLAELNRAFVAMQQAFAGLYDRAVLIDFTLEGDGFTPIFYGLQALVDAIADLLPTAEARAMHQLLDDAAGEQLGNLYREAGRRYILPFAVMAAGLAAVPLPFATMPVLTALQGSLVVMLGRLYGQEVTASQAGGIVSAIAGGFLAQAIGRELIKFIPGFGSVIAASWAAAYTWALGEAACLYFGDILGGKKPDPQRIQAAMKASFAAAQIRFKSGRDD
jgi:uncharacterized protein (DUF697 family)/energy-coupling factor transporter ATP-binding protein EcfA2